MGSPLETDPLLLLVGLVPPGPLEQRHEQGKGVLEPEPPAAEPSARSFPKDVADTARATQSNRIVVTLLLSVPIDWRFVLQLFNEQQMREMEEEELSALHSFKPPRPLSTLFLFF